MDLSQFKPVPVMDKLSAWMMPEDWQDRAQFGNKYDWYCGYGDGFHFDAVRVVEVGVKHGYSIASFLYGLEGRRAEVYLYDNNSAGGDVHEVGERLEAEFNCGVRAYVFDSQKDHLNNGPDIDFLHIDACHDEEAAFNDLIHFSPFLAEGGMIVVDDADDQNVSTAIMRFLGKDEEQWVVRRIPCTSGHILLAKGYT